MAGILSPGTTIPIKLSGSAAEMVTTSPAGGSLRFARKDSTAIGSANCSPRKPSTKRPPRISSRFQPAKRQLHLAPLREIALAGQQVAEDHAVTFEQHPAGCFDGALALNSGIGVQDCPASSAMAGTRSAAAALPGTALGVDE